MRMKDPYEAYIDTYNSINVYMSKNFYDGQSKSFHLEDLEGNMIPLSVQQHSDLYNGYTHYRLSIDQPLTIGTEYYVYSDSCRKTPAKYAHIVKTAEFAREFTNITEQLGTHYNKDKTTFTLWAPTAVRIMLCLYEGEQTKTYELKRENQGIFKVEVQGDLHGVPYTFLVRCNGAWTPCIDPYTMFSTTDGQKSVVIDETTLALPEKVEMEPQQSNTDAIIYEVSIRDMTSHSDIGVSHPKKFVGFIEENEITRLKNTGFSYIKDLGITHLQIMPVNDFGSVDEFHQDLYYNWGYDPMQFRALEGSYSLDPANPVCRIEEFARLVNTCHKNGIRVNLDVVFNHVYDKKRFALETLVPNYYFLMNQNGEFSNGSGCGNDIDTQPIMSKRYFLNTCRKLIHTFDIDGLRFDLMGILDINFMNEVAQTCRSIKPGFMIYGEGWNMPSFLPENQRASQQNQSQMPNIGHFSDRFREVIRGSNSDLHQRGYASGNIQKINEAMQVLAASCQDFVFNSPQKVVNFVECHDNHTLWDKNRVACQGEGRDLREKRQILANAMVLLAQGIAFIHSGQEFGRTKNNIVNSYNQPDAVNSIDYTRRNFHQTITKDTKELIKIRKEHPSFRLKTSEEIANNVSFETIENQVLVYKTNKDNDRNYVFFNPTSNSFQYFMNEKGKVIFDNGNSNDPYNQNLIIAPYSVLIYHLGQG